MDNNDNNNNSGHEVNVGAENTEVQKALLE